MQQDAHAAQLAQGWTALRNGKLNDALSSFQQIIQASPAHVDAHYGLAITQIKNGQREAARTNLQHCLELAKTEQTGKPNRDHIMILERMIQQRVSELDAR
jgi:Flp pilus assembly protein TadD